jgi:hypothetical protein
MLKAERALRSLDTRRVSDDIKRMLDPKEMNALDWFQRWDIAVPPSGPVYTRVRVRVVSVRVKKVNSRGVEVAVVFACAGIKKGASLYELAAHIATTLKWVIEGGGMWADKASDNGLDLQSLRFYIDEP